MRHAVLWVGLLACLLGVLWGASACQVEPTPSPEPTITVHGLAEEPTAAPTLVYDGHFPVGYPTPVPIIYNMNDYANRDWATLYPQFGPMGAWSNWNWLAVHQGPGQLNFGAIEQYLSISAKYQVTLRDGTVISKPIAISIQVFPEPGYDSTPEWVYRKIPGSPTLNGRLVGQVVDPDGAGVCPPLAAPKWGDPTWRDAYDEMVLALGAKYNDDPRIDSVWIATGMYGETVIEKDLGNGCYYRFGTSDFGQWVLNRVLPIYRQAFPTKPVYLINTGGGCLRKDSSAIAAALPVRIGLKHNSLTYDIASEYDVQGCGKMETMIPYTETTPIAFEHAFGANPWQVYWSTLNGLAHHADLFDLPHHLTEWDILDVLAQLKGLLHGYDQWEFIDRYLGRTLSNSPGVWIIFRDTQWPRLTGLTSGGSCAPVSRWGWGEEGRDWSFWLYRPDLPQGKALPLAQVPPNRDPNECDPVYPNIFTRYQELPAALRSNPPAEAKWWNDDGTIKAEIMDKIYGYYSSRRTNEPTDPYIYLDIDDEWAYWRALPSSQPEGTATYTVTVIYLDQGTDSWKLSYTNYQGQQVDKYVRKANSLKWKAATWRLTDMYLSDGLANGMDIILSSNLDGNDYFHMMLVEAVGRPIHLPDPEPTATPAPTLPANISDERVRDLQERTGNLQQRWERLWETLQQFSGF